MATPEKKKVQQEAEVKEEVTKMISVEVVQETRVQISFFTDEHNMGSLNIHGLGATGEIPYSEKNLEQVQPFVQRGLVIIKN